MSKVFNHQKIEKKWQKKWEKQKIYQVKDSVKNKKNFYHLVMFPYPSGDLHIGHWYNFAPADVYARLKRAQGFNVLSPIGFDSFGLPAENAAIKRKIHPKDWTYKNIGTMTGQLKSIGAVYDWSRKIITSDPEYYKWTQWIFLQLFKNGLAYKKKAAANWCPSCHTVLANEQVIDGECERCGHEVVQREIEQWLFKITDYAEKLLSGLDKIDWPEKTKIMQRNWIGKSEGAEIEFTIKDTELNIKAFTTRPDTLFGATYLVLSPEHPLIKSLEYRIKNLGEVKKYIAKAKRKTELQRTDLAKEKTGVELKGVKAINPANKKEIPIWVADYVLATYGTGAIMAVPAHDSRDFAFAKKFKVPIMKVINPVLMRVPNPAARADAAVSELAIGGDFWEGEGEMINSAKFNGMPSEKARWLITKFVAGKRKIQYRLRDWIVSRQRYWGAPIPMIYCERCAREKRGERKEMPGWYAVLEKDLPVLLPNVKNYLPTEEGKSPLAHSEKFINAKCPKCGGPAKRETDTMDTFVCSSWYYLRYVDPKNSEKFADAEKIKKWLPVDIYIGGAEHTVLHLLYSRFFTKALCDFGYLNFDEPFLKLRHQGIILSQDNQKMSKSRGNVVNPDDIVNKFGADAVRLYLCFMGPYDQGGPWNPTGILGVRRFLDRVFKLKSQPDAKENSALKRLLHQTIKKVGDDIEILHFNTAVSALMVFLNEIEKSGVLSSESYGIFLKILSPFAPYLAEELWQQLLSQRQSAFRSIHLEPWPKYDIKLIQEDKFELVIQINGRVRDKISVETNISQEEAEKIVFSREKIKNWLKGKKVKKIIFVPNRLINIVI